MGKKACDNSYTTTSPCSSCGSVTLRFSPFSQRGVTSFTSSRATNLNSKVCGRVLASRLTTHSLLACSAMSMARSASQLPSASPAPMMASRSLLRNCGARTFRRTVLAYDVCGLVFSFLAATHSVKAVE